MSNKIYRAYSEHLGNVSPEEFVAKKGELFWDPESTSLRIGNGSPGGQIISGGNNTNTSLLWAAKATSSTNYALTQAIAYDSLGNSFGLIFQGNWNGPGQVKSGIVKFDPLGNTIWNIDLSDGNSVNPWSLICDSEDNLYVITQRYTGSVYNNSVLKISGGDGSLMWQVDIQDSQNSNNMQVVSVSFDGFNGVIIAGTAYNGSGNDFFITSISSDGTNLAPTYTWGDQWDQEAYSLAVNNNTGEIILVGTKLDINDNAYYLEMVKFSAGGNSIWQKSITVDGNYNVKGTDVCLLSDGNWAIVATHELPNSGEGVITMKISDADGSVMWSREISNGCSAISSSIATDAQGHIYISASTYSGMSSNNNIPLLSRIMGAYDTDGNIIWQKYFRVAGDTWLIDNNWWNNVGSSGKTIAIYQDRLLLGTSLVPLNPNTGPVGSYGIISQLTTLSDNETLGIFEVRNSYLTDNVVSLTVTPTVFDFTPTETTLVAAETISSISGTLNFLVDYVSTETNQLVNGNYVVELTSDGAVKLSTNNKSIISNDSLVGVKLSLTDTDLAAGKYITVRAGGDNYSHLHIDSGNNTVYDLFLGDDNKYVKVDKTGNVLISTSDYGSNSAQWAFNIYGGITFPDSSIQIGASLPLSNLKSIVASSASWSDFQTTIAAL